MYQCSFILERGEKKEQRTVMQEKVENNNSTEQVVVKFFIDFLLSNEGFESEGLGR